MSAHTLGPWRVVESAQGNYIIESGDCGEIAKCKATANGEALSAFIAKACNAHDELVAALERLISDADTIRITQGRIPDRFPQVIEAARDALAKVQA